MTLETVKLSESRACTVTLNPPSLADPTPSTHHCAALQRYVSHPGRVLSALLSRSRLQRLPSGVFRYSSRPVAIARWLVQPEFFFSAEWQGDALTIHLDSCHLPGLPPALAQQSIQFGLRASIRPVQLQLMACATASLEICAANRMLWLPRPLLTALARQVLLVCLARLEARCQSRLRLGALGWLERVSDDERDEAPNGASDIL
ncbi:DUF1997 domain-containing protein [Cyanobium sp. NIES-981]|uniref:DUF1997 domain-containing protein n=1 Tax=Cyanobium sp. NIES-981 TaxID=1851505 RepID=UPI000B35E855